MLGSRRRSGRHRRGETTGKRRWQGGGKGNGVTSLLERVKSEDE